MGDVSRVTHALRLPDAELERLVDQGCVLEVDLYTAAHPVTGLPATDLASGLERLRTLGLPCYLVTDAGQAQTGDPYAFSASVLASLAETIQPPIRPASRLAARAAAGRSSDGPPAGAHPRPPLRDRRWDPDARGECVADARPIAARLEALRLAAARPRWVTEEPDAHLWPHIRDEIDREGSGWTSGEYAVDHDGRLVVDLVHAPVGRDRRRAVLQADVLRLLGMVIDGATYIEDQPL